MKFSIKDFFSKCDQIHSFLVDFVIFTEEILMENIFFAVCNSHQQLPPEYDWLMKIDSKGYVNATSMKLNF